MRVPIGEITVEALGVRKHVVHVPHRRHVPTRDVCVEATVTAEKVVHVSHATHVPIGNVDTVIVVAVFKRLRVRVARVAVLQRSLYFPIVVERRVAGPSMVPVGCTLIYVRTVRRTRRREERDRARDDG